MDYLVIELKPKPIIITDILNEPAIYKNRQDAERACRLCKQGLVYPIVDIMSILERIRILSKERHSRTHILDELLALTDEI